MKKTLTLLLTLLITAVAFGQTNWSVKSLKSPTELETISASEGTLFNLTIECENIGQDTVNIGDSLIYNMIIFNPANTQNPILVEYPARAASGSFLIVLATKQVLPGETYDISVPNLKINLFVRNSLPIVIGVESYLFDRSNPIIDVDSTNNEFGLSTIWYNEYRNGVSVNEVDYNNNITSFPNPASNIMNIEMQTVQLSNVSIELVDLTGKVVLDKTFEDSFQEGAFRVDVAGVNNGFYILKVTNGENISTSKVIVSH